MSGPDRTKKFNQLPSIRFSASNRFSLSPVPSHSSNMSYMPSNSLYHKRHITSIMHGPYKHSVSLRSTGSYGFDSQKGFNPNNSNKDNQDSIFVHPYLKEDCKLFGVCDGHGVYGKEISAFIASKIPAFLQNKAINAGVLGEAVIYIDQQLKNCGYDTSYSGSTLVLCLIQKFKLYTANVGDSRAVLGRRGFIRWECIPLTVDHKPEVPQENLRIKNCGGRVAASGNVGPLRVWMPDKNSPGLAMSRSLGDSSVHSIGVSSEPDIFERILGEDDEFIVLGSDGLFEFLSNQDVVSIAGDHLGNPKAACEELISTARSRWARVIIKQNQQIIDDISCIVVYLK